LPSRQPPSIPDYAWPIVGWRVWRVSRRRDELRLRSVLRDEVWEPRRKLVAGCEAGHAAPDDCCGCGIYAVRDPASARRHLVGRNETCDVSRVLGEVALWGWVLEAAGGWRAACAYPARIVLAGAGRNADAPPPDELADALAVYGVPIVRA